MIWGLLGGHDGHARVTPLLFFEGHPGIFNDHRESGPRFNVSSEGWCFFDPVTTLGNLHYTGYFFLLPDQRLNT